MRGYFKNGNLNMIHVLSDGESIYYPEDEKKKEIIGHNKTKCNEMKIYMKEDDSTVDKIMFYTNPEATLSPLKDVKLIDTKLETFEWFGKWRPYNRWQIFNWEN